MHRRFDEIDAKVHLRAHAFFRICRTMKAKLLISTIHSRAFTNKETLIKSTPLGAQAL